MGNERASSDAAQSWRGRMRFRALARDTRGAGMVEYIIVLGVVALGAQTAFRAFGKSIADKARQQGDTVAAIGDGCVGGLCTVAVLKEKEN